MSASPPCGKVAGDVGVEEKLPVYQPNDEPTAVKRYRTSKCPVASESSMAEAAHSCKSAMHAAESAVSHAAMTPKAPSGRRNACHAGGDHERRR